MDLKSKLALLGAMWTEVQSELSAKFSGNEDFESPSDDITWALFELASLTK